MRRRLLLPVAAACALAAAALGLALAGSSGAARLDACGLPDGRPLWLDYGGGPVPSEVRKVFSRPGVVVATSGTVLPNRFRNAGAQTVYFELKLPQYVGTPAQPADPASVTAAADRLYDLAQAATACPFPRIALNELLGPAAPSPWSAEVAAYRGNVLALVQRLRERGARPALFVHGNPSFGGDAAPWWRAVGAAADVVYEAYYRATTLDRLGRILGPRRVRLGIRSVVRKLVTAGVPRERIGIALGFQSRIGTFGREGLQPTSSWLRVVKWQALAAQQVAVDTGFDSVWSWGWGVLSGDGKDPDKPLAACVYLWSRDPDLCDAPAAATAAGTTLDANRLEGLIAVPDGVTCISAAGKLPTASLPPLRRILGTPDAALDVAFARQVLRRAMPVASVDVLAAEQAAVDRAFGSSVPAYLAALQERGVTRAGAREAIADGLRRQLVADAIARGEATGTVATWIADSLSAAVATATCARDVLPGSGDFPASDQRDVSVPPTLAALPFLFDDVNPPALPTGLAVSVSGGRVVLDWDDGVEPDLAGYLVSRGPGQAGPWEPLDLQPRPRSRAFDTVPAPGTIEWYRIVAVDLSGNTGPPLLYAYAAAPAA